MQAPHVLLCIPGGCTLNPFQKSDHRLDRFNTEATMGKMNDYEVFTVEMSGLYHDRFPGY